MHCNGAEHTEERQAQFRFLFELVAYAILDAGSGDWLLFSSWILLKRLSPEVLRSTAGGVA